MNELITKVRVRNVKSILSNVFQSSGAALTDGNGTTANGSAVDLGGAITSPIVLASADPNTSSLSVGGNTGYLRNGAKGFEASPLGIGVFAGAGGHFITGDDNGFVFGLGSDANGDVFHRNVSGYFTRRGVITATSTSTLTPNSDNTYQSCLTAQAEALTIANPTGTPFNSQDLVIRIKDNGTPRAITFGDQFRAINTALPTTTTISKTLYLCALWNAADSKWDTVNGLEV